MTLQSLPHISEALADLVATASSRVASVHLRHGRHLTATLWRDDLAIVSEQALPRRDVFPVQVGGAEPVEAQLLGRDDATNIAVLKIPGLVATAPEAGTARPGALAIAVGVTRDGAAPARLGAVNQAGPAWQSQHGGRIDAYIRLDLTLSQSEEGGPALDAAGGVIGMTTFGPRGQVLVIPHATIERVLPALAEGGHVARGYLGATLQPVALPDLGSDDGQGRGLMVMAAAEGSPAAAAGLLPGDIVLRVDGDRVGHVSRLASKLGPESIGRALILTLLRGGAVIDTSLTPTERPAE
ncbi:MAG: serine protease [Asticcacaulis sp.]|nr:serine protease [Asticcacaulis sp.]